jgi:hypothetical protein
MLKYFTQIYTVEEFIRSAKRSHKQEMPIQCCPMLDSPILSPSVKIFRSFRFLGAFAEFRKANIRFMSVCLSAWNNSARTGQISTKFDI